MGENRASDELVEIGRITHFFSRISVAVVELRDRISVGDKIWIKGATTDFKQTVESMQIQHKNVETAGPGESIGLKVIDRVRNGDIVYRLPKDG
ncbi:MAG: translation elongation factor-like protein [Candidatus Bathyarchaeia archaeon]